nr:hypothetical protein [Rhodococcus sp. (in: high G+C Gram-positive bacteria)]
MAPLDPLVEMGIKHLPAIAQGGVGLFQHRKSEWGQEQELPQALNDIRDAVYDLTHSGSMLIDLGDGDHQVAVRPSLYDEMIANPTRSIITGIGGSGSAHSRPPVRLDGIDWVSEVDRQAREWHPVGRSTPDRLVRLCTDGWRPQDVAELRKITRRIKGYINAAEAYLNDRHSFSVTATCPECGESAVERDGVRSPALSVNADGATCAACHHYWPSALFEQLARLISE